jgi:hypothetical protein
MMRANKNYNDFNKKCNIYFDLEKKLAAYRPPVFIFMNFLARFIQQALSIFYECKREWLFNDFRFPAGLLLAIGDPPAG